MATDEKKADDVGGKFALTREDARRYDAAMHGMQSGVAMDHSLGSTDGSPKHLRVGVNSALVNDAALVRLLIAKGIFTVEEYGKELADEAEREQERYETRLGVKLG